MQVVNTVDFVGTAKSFIKHGTTECTEKISKKEIRNPKHEARNR
jgi:hypothetical protein